MANPTSSTGETSFAMVLDRAVQTDRKQDKPGGAYDFSAVTRQQLHGLVNDLIKHGQMSLDESSPLVGMMGPRISADGSGRVSWGEPEGSMDVFAKLQAGIEWASSRGEYRNAERYLETVEALKRLQGTALEGVGDGRKENRE